MVEILSIPDRIQLFKEINRIHKDIYGWGLVYANPWRAEYIDIERDVRLNENVLLNESDARNYYFYDTLSKDITLLRSIFAWEAWYFHHLNPYKSYEYYHPSGAKAFESCKLTEDDYITDNFGKRIRLDIGHPVRCSESLIEVQQRKDDGRIWLSTNWLYFPECYGSAAPIDEAILATITKPAGGDEGLSDRISEKYRKANKLNRDEFTMSLERYFRGDTLRGGHWARGYAFAASRTWKIKNRKQLDEAIKVEDGHFQRVLDQYIRWLRSEVIRLPEKDETALKEKIADEYRSFPRKVAQSLCELLVEEDKAAPSDVYLWWGGEPNRDACYALLSLYFEIDPEDIGTSRFNESVSRNLRAILNIAEEDAWLNSTSEYEPIVWRAVYR